MELRCDLGVGETFDRNGVVHAERRVGRVLAIARNVHPGICGFIGGEGNAVIVRGDGCRGEGEYSGSGAINAGEREWAITRLYGCSGIRSCGGNAEMVGGSRSEHVHHDAMISPRSCGNDSTVLGINAQHDVIDIRCKRGRPRDCRFAARCNNVRARMIRERERPH